MRADNEEVSWPWPLPQWLPDETFFSLASRYHAISGNRLPAHTNLALFGLHRGGSQHDLPTHLDRFAQRTEGRLGAAEAIVRNHTILPFYLPTRSTEDATAAIESLTGSPGGMLKYRLGILTSRFRANHPLKACTACMDADEAEHGVAYWHRIHQFPGIWVCRRHDAVLRESILKSNGVQRFGWLLPSAKALAPSGINENRTPGVGDLSRFALLAERWSQVAPAGLHADSLAAAYRTALATRGLTLGRNEIAQSYCLAIANLRVAPELSALPATRQEAMAQINRWIFAPQGNTHPLRQLSFIFWLFQDWESFWAAYKDPTRDGSEAEIPAAQDAAGAHDLRRSTLIAHIKSGASATAAARAAGVDTGTAIAWAAAAGISTSRRPKTMKDDKCTALIADLKAGCAKAEAAMRYSVSLQSVTRLLRSEVGLQGAWRSARSLKAQADARSAWTQALRAFAAEGTAAARRHEPGAYAWLYRNDRTWLTASCADAAKAPNRRAGTRLDWDSRDAALANEVRSAAMRLAADNPGGNHLKLWQLYQFVPELKAKLGALARLPLTRKVISEVTRPRSQRKKGDSLL